MCRTRPPPITSLRVRAVVLALAVQTYLVHCMDHENADSMPTLGVAPAILQPALLPPLLSAMARLGMKEKEAAVTTTDMLLGG